MIPILLDHISRGSPYFRVVTRDGFQGFIGPLACCRRYIEVLTLHRARLAEREGSHRKKGHHLTSHRRKAKPPVSSWA